MHFENEKNINMPLSYGSRHGVFVFGLLAAVFMLSFGPINWEFPAWSNKWLATVILFSTFVLILFAASFWVNKANDNVAHFLVTLSLGYSAVILIPALLHWFALLSAPDYQPVNFTYTTIADWKSRHWYFTGMYLLFPLMLPLLYFIIERVNLVFITRTLALFFFMSVATQYYQGLVNPYFLNNWLPGSGRTGGLASDPNGYQLLVYLLTPIFIGFSLLEKDIKWIIFIVTVAVSSILGLYFSGGRTSVAGIAILFVSSPLIIAIAMNQWTFKVRIFLALIPFLVLLISLLLLIEYRNQIGDFGVLGERIAYTIEKIMSDGIRGLVFSGDARGYFWQIGWILLWKSPLGGWGAGGFVREYPNEAFRHTGEVPTWIDYVGNHYLMIPIDLGLPALLFNLLIIFIVIYYGINALWCSNRPRIRLLLATLIFANIIFLLMIAVAPPYFPELIFAWTLNLAAILFISKKVLGDRMLGWFSGRRIKNFGLIIILAISLSTFGIYQTAFGKNGYLARLYETGTPLNYERNCYGIETIGTNRWQWCGKNARLKISLENEQKGELVLYLNAANPDLKDRPLIVRYGGVAGLTQELMLTAENTSFEIRIPLNQDYLVEIPAKNAQIGDRFVVLSIDVSHTWVPKRFGVSDDGRELGVSVHLPASPNHSK